MSRKIQLEPTHGYAWRIIGIASDSAIWKLCFELNSALGINLKAIAFDPDSDPGLDTNSLPSLFRDTQIRATLQPVECYEDMDSFPRREYVLLQPQKASLPAEVRAFSFFLVVRTPLEDVSVSDSTLQQLNSLEVVRSAVDLTHQKNLKNALL